MAQSGYGKICFCNDCYVEVPIASTATDVPYGDFRVFGQGIAEVDSGAVVIAGMPSGAVRLTTTNEAAHSIAVGTTQGFSPALNGPLAAECRVQLNDIDTKTVFFGFSDDAAVTAIMPVTGTTTTLTLSDSDLCGFVLDAALTSDEEWHFAHNGGSATGVTDSTAVVSGVDAVAAEWDVLRVEIDVDGTARWYINGDLGKTLVGAVAPATVFAAYVMVQAAGASNEELDLDYIAVEAYRDWTR